VPAVCLHIATVDPSTRPNGEIERTCTGEKIAARFLLTDVDPAGRRSSGM
jgi:hypothetical protein